jgi:ABC-type transport system involved in multi-copper enzyme maturation permease subunit
MKKLFSDQGYILIESLISLILLGITSGIIVMFFTGLFKNNTLNKRFDVFPELQRDIRYCKNTRINNDTSYSWDRFIIQRKVESLSNEIKFKVKATLKNDTTEIIGFTFYKHNETL